MKQTTKGVKVFCYDLETLQLTQEFLSVKSAHAELSNVYPTFAITYSGFMKALRKNDFVYKSTIYTLTEKVVKQPWYKKIKFLNKLFK